MTIGPMKTFFQLICKSMHIDPKKTCSSLNFRIFVEICILSKKTISRNSKDTRADSHRVRDHPWSFQDPAGPLIQVVPDTIIFKPILGCEYHFYIAPIILEHFFGHCGPLSGLKRPSWTFMDPRMDPKMDPARQISGDP